MKPQVRKYGSPPYSVAVIHGGPGGAGYMAPVARELQNTVSVLEPLQGADSVQGQLNELRDQLLDQGDSPLALIGSSWGAMLALLFTAEHQQLVKKLILVGCGSFDAKISATLNGRRLERLNPWRQEQLKKTKDELECASAEESNRLFRRVVELSFPADTYDPLTTDMELLDVQYEIFKKVWPEFEKLRDTPRYLEERFSQINIPVIVIHGDYDPHSIEGVRPFLSKCLKTVQFYILPRCGHLPWIEKHAREPFFEILKRELNTSHT